MPHSKLIENFFFELYATVIKTNSDVFNQNKTKTTQKLKVSARLWEQQRKSKSVGWFTFMFLSGEKQAMWGWRYYRVTHWILTWALCCDLVLCSNFLEQICPWHCKAAWPGIVVRKDASGGHKKSSFTKSCTVQSKNVFSYKCFIYFYFVTPRYFGSFNKF